MESERTNARVNSDASVIRGAGMSEDARASGRFDCVCIGPDGREKWRDTAYNTVTTAGKNLALDTYLAGNNYTVTGPFMGLISSLSYSAIATTDTMIAHGGWLEAGGVNAPQYTAPRKTAAWNGASGGSKSLSAPLAFSMTANGTVKGCFLVFGPGASSTIDNTGGTLYSAGLFTGGDKSVGNGDTLNISYSGSM